MTASLKALWRVAYFWYIVYVQGIQVKIKALINSDSKVNIITPAYTTKLGLIIQKTNIEAWIIDGSHLKTYDMVSTSFFF